MYDICNDCNNKFDDDVIGNSLKLLILIMIVRVVMIFIENIILSRLSRNCRIKISIIKTLI